MTGDRPKLGWRDLRGARVGVWGFGQEGQASLRKLRSMGVQPVLVDDAPAANGPETVLATEAGGLEELAQCEIVVKTPGISRYSPAATQLQAAGVVIVGGVGLWLQEADLERVVIVTGTKGKSTTSSVLGHLLAGLGYRPMVGGNIGAAPYDPNNSPNNSPNDSRADYDYWVIEVSSYMATDLASSPPVVAVTSLHPDHLPWHGTVEQYYRDKLSAASQPGAELTVANGDSDLLRDRAGLLGPSIDWVSEHDDPGADWMAPLGLPGGHNRRNALIARRVLHALAETAGDHDLKRRVADDNVLRQAAAGFTPLPSRLTTVGHVDGVTFVDDSLSTNVLPTLAALDAFPGKRVALIVGGQDRGIDYTPLAEGVKSRLSPTHVLTLPDSGPRISATFTATATPANSAFSEISDCPDLETAVRMAYQWARPDGVVLLSPAAPSFGHFRDYKDRAAQFTLAMRTCDN
jgi:UDP-N-acetylmuramoylalanine--D-glutamate ligase